MVIYPNKMKKILLIAISLSALLACLALLMDGHKPLLLFMTFMLYVLVGRQMHHSQLRPLVWESLLLGFHLIPPLLNWALRLSEVDFLFPHSTMLVFLALVWARLSMREKPLASAWQVFLLGFLLWFTLTPFNIGSNFSLFFLTTAVIYFIMGILLHACYRPKWMLVCLLSVPHFIANFLSWQFINEALYPFHFPLNSLVSLGSLGLGVWARDFVKHNKVVPYAGLALGWALVVRMGGYYLIPSLDFQRRTSNPTYMMPTASLQALTPETPAAHELTGKIAYLDFWSTTCAPCIRQMPMLEELHQHYANEPRVIIGTLSGLQLDKIERIRRFVNRTTFHFAQYYDSTGRWLEQLEVKSVPIGFLIDAQGQTVLRHSGNGGPGANRILKQQLIAKIDELLEELNE